MTQIKAYNFFYLQRSNFTLQLSPVPPSPKRQRKRRHLSIDAQTQIHKDQLKQNFSDRNLNPGDPAE